MFDVLWGRLRLKTYTHLDSKFQLINQTSFAMDVCGSKMFISISTSLSLSSVSLQLCIQIYVFYVLTGSSDKPVGIFNAWQESHLRNRFQVVFFFLWRKSNSQRLGEKKKKKKGEDIHQWYYIKHWSEKSLQRQNVVSLNLAFLLYFITN